MPTKYTPIMEKIMVLTAKRRSVLHRMAAEKDVFWEYVPVLEYIRANPGCMQVDISKKLKLTPAAITLSTKKLESLGLIEKRTDSDNLRIKMLYMTEKGTAMLREGTHIFDTADKMAFEDFTDEEAELMKKMLDKAIKNISAYNTENKDGNMPWSL